MPWARSERGQTRELGLRAYAEKLLGIEIPDTQDDAIISENRPSFGTFSWKKNRLHDGKQGAEPV
jgi:hypothetical protein